MRRSAIVFVLMLGASCRVGTLSPEEFDRAYPVGRLTTLANPGRDESLAALRDAVGGPVRITSLSFSDARTFITAQNPRARRSSTATTTGTRRQQVAGPRVGE